jgi:hypothetical protein
MADLRAHAQQLKSEHIARDAMFRKYDEMYLLDWKEKANRKLQHAQVTASPDFRNQVQAMVRLMIATDPQINVKKNKKSEGVNVEAVEEFLNTVLYQSGRLAGEPVHYPLITAGILYDEMHAAITATADMLSGPRKAADDASAPTARLSQGIRGTLGGDCRRECFMVDRGNLSAAIQSSGTAASMLITGG